MHETHDTDHALVLHAVEDRQAFAPLYTRYAERVRRYIAARVQHPHDADDLTADVFVRALEGLATFRNQHTLSFAAWLFTLARHVILDHVRQHKRRPPHIALDDVADHAATHVEPHVVLAQQDAVAALHAHIARLPRRRRQVVTLKYLHGLSNIEIACCLDLDTRTIAAHLSRADRALRPGGGESPLAVQREGWR